MEDVCEKHGLERVCAEGCPKCLDDLRRNAAAWSEYHDAVMPNLKRMNLALFACLVIAAVLVH